MTLIQKLNDSIITNINIVESENRMCYDYNHLELAENCEVIADEHAIEFAIFTKDYNYHSSFNIWVHSFDLVGQRFTSKQLIEKFKTEKGL